MSLQIATYNIQYGFGLDGEYDLPRIVRAVNDLDILCLQEVSVGWAACNGDNQPEILSRELNRYAAFSTGFEVDASTIDQHGRIVNKRRGFGNMVLSRWPIVYSRSHSLARPPTQLPDDFPDPRTDLPRTILEAIIASPVGALRVMSLHLSHLPGGQRIAQVRELRQLLNSLSVESALWTDLSPKIHPWTEGQEAPAAPVGSIVAGDFNFSPGQREYFELPLHDSGVQLFDCWTLAHGPTVDHATTCVEEDGSSTLDYLFVSTELKDSVQTVDVRRDCDGSDHQPLVMELSSQL